MKHALLLPIVAAGAIQFTQFRAAVEGVRVDVLVDDGGKPVGGLKAEDFELRDNGVVQTIESVAISNVPISMMIALDTSDSVAGRILRELEQGVDAAVSALQSSDLTALLTFASDIRLRTDCGSDTGAVRHAMSQVRAGGSTSLWDAAFAALTFPDEAPGVRRLVIIFSDGNDTSSWLHKNAVFDKARRTDAVVYAVEIRDAYSPRQLMNQSGVQQRVANLPDSVFAATGSFLEDLAQLSGGPRFRVDDE